ncbi:hypothetical protein [Phyllobacterium endophyticum]|uniref:hypothetical protein n=1 Tax=Phyllobacterium endophyticum TaxID=1149773 RepID=UPI0011C9E981|nr:hypothetical protein [Phyllobacterium endophyticum]TXR46572.1 hypothetical protein FVA77_24405 [Phyllobacterium endophyticum]
MQLRPSIGLIVTDLVKNAIEYAFPLLNAEDAISVYLRSRQVRLEVDPLDNGIGRNTVTTKAAADLPQLKRSGEYGFAGL